MTPTIVTHGHNDHNLFIRRALQNLRTLRTNVAVQKQLIWNRCFSQQNLSWRVKPHNTQSSALKSQNSRRVIKKKTWSCRASTCSRTLLILEFHTLTRFDNKQVSSSSSAVNEEWSATDTWTSSRFNEYCCPSTWNVITDGKKKFALRFKR